MQILLQLTTCADVNKENMRLGHIAPLKVMQISFFSHSSVHNKAERNLNDKTKNSISLTITLLKIFKNIFMRNI